MTADLVAFLRAQLDADEQVARKASGGGRWHYSGGDAVGAWTLHDEDWEIASLTTYDTEEYDYAERMPAVRSPAYVDADANGAHMARWDPARVLAEVDAKRKIVDMYDHCSRRAHEDSEAGRPSRAVETIRDTLHTVILEFAQLHTGRPGFREEWRI